MRKLVRRALTPRPPRPERLIEEEVEPGRILLALRARQSVALVAAALGIGIAVGPVANSASPFSGHATSHMILPPGRRLDPV